MTNFLCQGEPSCRITIYTYRYEREQGSDGSLESYGPPQEITYRVTERLLGQLSGFVFVHWGNDEALVALPLMSCKPKIVKEPIVMRWDISSEAES